MPRPNKINPETENTKPQFGKGETVCLTYTAYGDKPTHYITTNYIRDTYFLYEVKDNQIIKTKRKSNNPTDLYKYMKIEGDKNE